MKKLSKIILMFNDGTTKEIKEVESLNRIAGDYSNIPDYLLELTMTVLKVIKDVRGNKK